MLSLFGRDLVAGVDDAMEQQRLRRTLKSLVHGMCRKLDTILDALPSDDEAMQFYRFDDQMRETITEELNVAGRELEQVCLCFHCVFVKQRFCLDARTLHCTHCVDQCASDIAAAFTG